MYALRDEQGNITHDTDCIIKVVKGFYPRLYASNIRPVETTERTSVVCDVPLVTRQEVERALKGLKWGRAAGHDGIIVDVLKEGADILLKKLDALLLKWLLRTEKCPYPGRIEI